MTDSRDTHTPDFNAVPDGLHELVSKGAAALAAMGPEKLRDLWGRRNARAWARYPNRYVTLAELLDGRFGDDAFWRHIGAEIRRFHAAGVVHADLNARNVLVGKKDAVHLVDFDRARISVRNAAAFEANLRRLRRSLDKLWPSALVDRLPVCWANFLQGYQGALATS